MSAYSSCLSNPDLSLIFQSLTECRDQLWTLGRELVITTIYYRLLLLFRVLRAFPVTGPEMMKTAFLNFLGALSKGESSLKLSSHV